jgi:Leucine-rich repeat (LRR) protein
MISITDANYDEYAQGMHLEVRDIAYRTERQIGDFFGTNRFPNLEVLDIQILGAGQDTLIIECPNLIIFRCHQRHIKKILFNCSTNNLSKEQATMDNLSKEQATMDNLSKELATMDTLPDDETSVIRSSVLREFNIYVNLLVSLRVECPSLIKLSCGCNKLSSLVVNCPLLEHLDCSSNNLTKVSLKDTNDTNVTNVTGAIFCCQSIQFLNCFDNQISELELVSSSLEIFSCSRNQLTEFDISSCPSIKHLSCAENPLTNLNSVKFLENLDRILCSKRMKETVECLRDSHLPNLEISYAYEFD